MDFESKRHQPESVPLMTKDGIQVGRKADGSLALRFQNQRMRSRFLVDIKGRQHLKMFAVAKGYFAATSDLSFEQLSVNGETLLTLRCRGPLSDAKPQAATQVILTIIDDGTGDLVLEETYNVRGSQML